MDSEINQQFLSEYPNIAAAEIIDELIPETTSDKNHHTHFLDEDTLKFCCSTLIDYISGDISVSGIPDDIKIAEYDSDTDIDVSPDITSKTLYEEINTIMIELDSDTVCPIHVHPVRRYPRLHISLSSPNPKLRKIRSRVINNVAVNILRNFWNTHRGNKEKIIIPYNYCYFYAAQEMPWCNIRISEWRKALICAINQFQYEDKFQESYQIDSFYTEINPNPNDNQN